MGKLQTSSVSEPKSIDEVIHFDLGDHSQESVIVLSGEGTFEIGEVLGVVTASGKYAKYNNAAGDGRETAVAVSREAGDATAADVPCVPVNKRVTTLIKGGLVFDAGQDQAAQDAAIADLEAIGFKVSIAI